MEKEVKLLLQSQQDYDKLITSLGAPESVQEQTNTYFTNQYLSDNKIAFRKRDTDTKSELTIKRNTTVQNGFFQSQEENVPLQQMSVQDFIYRIRDFAPDWIKDHVNDLKTLVVFKTTRKIYMLDDFCLEIDNVHYQNPYQFESFEIECETDKPEEYKIKIEAFLNKIGIKGCESTDSKLRRAFNPTK